MMQREHEAPQNQAALAPQFQAVVLSWKGVIMLLKTPKDKYPMQPMFIVLDLRRVDDISETAV
jgi:hypothetical protein